MSKWVKLEEVEKIFEKPCEFGNVKSIYAGFDMILEVVQNEQRILEEIRSLETKEIEDEV